MTQTIAIIGGGISGAFMVLNCLRQATFPLKILWFDKDGLFCKGLAYSTSEETHLLNVRVSNMSVFADQPSHFVNWLKDNNYAYEAGDFVPRFLYGRYVMDLFQQLKEDNPAVEIIQKTEEVLSVEKNGITFTLKTQFTYNAHKVVLAIGNFPPAHPRSLNQKFRTSPAYFQNVFQAGVLDKIALSRSVTIIGAGLTMVDVVLALSSRNYKGSINILSPHGYLPEPHDEQVPVTELLIDLQKTYSLLELYTLVKQHLRKAQASHTNPQLVIDSLRPHVQQLWLNFSRHDQQQFLRHLRHKWGVARHRAPRQSMQVLHQLIENGQLQMLKGRIFNIEEKETGLELFYKTGKGIINTIISGAVVNCTGPEPDFNKVNSSLVKQLIMSGLVVGHELSYGLKASKEGELLPGFFTLGPPLKGVLWESTAVPEIRRQAAELAEIIISD